jgi:hypothetical protein
MWANALLRSSLLLLAVLAVCFSSLSADAAPINYGSHVGTSVTYIDVTETSTTSDLEPLFGAPVFSGNSIDFNPVGFDAHASGADGNDTTGARLTFSVQALAGDAITNIQFSEAGDATLAGVGNDSTAASVTASGTLTINSVDGAAITPIIRPISLNFSPSGGTYGLASDGGGLPIYHTTWTGSLGVNINNILTTAAVPFTLGATNISVDIVNTLSALSQAGTQALINKQDFGGVSITVNVPGGGGDPEIPEPGTGVLASIFLAAAAAIRGRRDA